MLTDRVLFIVENFAFAIKFLLYIVFCELFTARLHWVACVRFFFWTMVAPVALPFTTNPSLRV
jgi:hypothetical protein